MWHRCYRSTNKKQQDPMLIFRELFHVEWVKFTWEVYLLTVLRDLMSRRHFNRLLTNTYWRTQPPSTICLWEFPILMSTSVLYTSAWSFCCRTRVAAEFLSDTLLTPLRRCLWLPKHSVSACIDLPSSRDSLHLNRISYGIWKSLISTVVISRCI